MASAAISPLPSPPPYAGEDQDGGPAPSYTTTHHRYHGLATRTPRVSINHPKRPSGIGPIASAVVRSHP